MGNVGSVSASNRTGSVSSGNTERVSNSTGSQTGPVGFLRQTAEERTLFNRFGQNKNAGCFSSKNIRLQCRKEINYIEVLRFIRNKIKRSLFIRRSVWQTTQKISNGGRKCSRTFSVYQKPPLLPMHIRDRFLSYNTNILGLVD